MNEKYAAQLYTVREELKQGIPNVLKELKAMGWLVCKFLHCLKDTTLKKSPLA